MQTFDLTFAELAETGTLKTDCVIWTAQNVWSEGHRRPRSHRGTCGRRQRSLRLKQPTPSYTEKGHVWWHISACFTCLAYIFLILTCFIILFDPIQIWDIVEKYDTGCTAGGGKDSINVFYDAGLLFESNLVPGTNYRKGETQTQTQLFISLLVYKKSPWPLLILQC